MEALRERFGKYHVLEKIAQGGMAEVYKVKTVGIAGFEKVQALKRILPASAREARFIRSFIDEARIAVELTHRNIVQVFDFGKADGELFMAMELIEGKDLRSAMQQGLARERGVPLPVAAYIISEVAQGLDYAHRKADGYGTSMNIVHCDVSPSNVMLSDDGYVKILDFGIARATFASALERRRLRGKPRYMAPEQTWGEPPTSAADVFALGIIAWELFTGLPLFRGPNLKAILEMVRTVTPARIDTHNPDVPREIVEAIATALQREPLKRGSAAELATACARTALAGGAQKLATWLTEIEARPAPADEQWHVEATSISVPKEDVSAVAEAPERPTIPSLAQSLANLVVPREIGDGTPGFDAEVPPTVTAARAIAAEFTRETSRPSAQRLAWDPATNPAARFGDRDPTASTSAMDLSFAQREQTVPTEPFTRPSVEAMQFNAPEDTHHGMTVFADELSLEADNVPLPNDMLADEPIDDELAIGDVSGGALTERRRVVVVAALLSGAPTDVLRPITKALSELAYQRGGVVTAQADDSLVIAFGLEVAGEDDVAVAMGWALDAQTYLRDTKHDAEAKVALRIAARTTIATSTPMPPGVSRPSSQGPRVPADAAEDARALAKDADPERPLFATATGRQTGGIFELREVQSRRVRRGKVLELLGARGVDYRVAERERLVRRGAFVGRQQQLAALDAWFQRAIAADRRLVVLVTGPAGSGKTRLVAELIARRRAADAKVRTVITGASPAHHLAPFSLVIDFYQAGLALPPARGRNARQQLLARVGHLLADKLSPERARAVTTDLDRAMELRDGVGVGAPEVADLRPRVAAGVAAWRAALSDRNAPLLTVIEDIHLADNASLEVMRHTLAVSASGPELMVLTARPDGPAPPAVDLVLSVGDLDGAALRALVTDRLGEAATPANIAAVLARGGGNPLFVEELAQAVGEAGADVPTSARDVVAARVDRLSPRARTALRFASVFGGASRVRLLEELVDETVAVVGTDSMAGEGLGTEVDELVAAGFIARSGDADIEFPRGLVREVVYDGMSARAQRDSHGRVGRLLASRFFAGREETPAEIAEHLERGGEAAGAAAFWLRAGRLALGASDALAAVDCFTRTITLERELGAKPATPTSRTRRREAYAGRETAHRLAGDLVSDPGDLDELELLCAGDAARLADVAIRRAHRTLRTADYGTSMEATITAEDRAVEARDDRLRGEALRIRGEILERLGRYDEALTVVAGARELFHRKGVVHDEMAALVGRGRIHLMRAHYEAARDAYRPVMALIDKTHDPWLERIVSNHVAIIEMCLGNFAVAMGSAQRSLDLCRRYGDRAREGDALSVSAIIQLEVGLYQQAAETFSDALDILGRTNSRWSRADCLIYFGICQLRRGAPDGLAMIAEAVAEARRLGARYLEANGLVARAACHLRRGDLAAAIEDAAAGTAVAAESTLVGYEIQGLARHGLALARSRRIAEARHVVHRALALLEHQRYLEGSEEEVLSACAEVLDAANDHARAVVVRERGRASAQRKFDALIDPVWRAAYAAIPEIAALLAT
ncbi:MAG TPA: protein kinase [Kofleriaceae bacterium]